LKLASSGLSGKACASLARRRRHHTKTALRRNYVCLDLSKSGPTMAAAPMAMTINRFQTELTLGQHLLRGRTTLSAISRGASWVSMTTVTERSNGCADTKLYFGAKFDKRSFTLGGLRLPISNGHHSPILSSQAAGYVDAHGLR
jgi:hypothetical protein